MGRPIARSQKDTMPYTRASTLSRNASEEGCKVLDITTSGSHQQVKAMVEEKRGSVVEPFILHYHLENLARKKAFSNGKFRHLGKQSAVSIPPYQRLDPGSPSESYSSSKISHVGSSSSSSPSSTSSLNETVSLAVGELSPIVGTGFERNQTWYSPTRERYQRCGTPSKKWDDSDMQFKNSLFKPTNNYIRGAEVSDNVALEQEAGVRSRKTTRRHTNSKYLEFDKELVDARVVHGHGGNIPHVSGRRLTEVCSEKASNSIFPSQGLQKDISDVKQGSRLFKPPRFPALHDDAPSKCKCERIHTHSVSNFSSTLVCRGYLHSGSKESSFKHKGDYCKDVGHDMYEEGLTDESNAAAKMRRGGFNACETKNLNQVQGSAYKNSTFTNSNACEMKNLNQVQGSAFKNSTRINSDVQALPISAPGCSSTPYEVDIGVDACSLQLRDTFWSPVTIAKPVRSSSLHHPTNATKEVPCFQIPTTPETKLDSKHSADSVSTEFSTENYASKALLSRKKESPRASSHSSYGMHKNGKSSLTPVLKTRVHHRQSRVLVNDGKYTEKADAFTPHAPLLPKETIYREASKPNSYLPFSSTSQWDWRSKSLGAKASIQSAVRSLEATFTATRSISLPKTRPGVHKEPKFEGSKLLDRVFISPIRARSKQVGILKPMDRPCKKRIEIKDNGAIRKRDAKAITSNLSSNHGIAAGAIIRPVLPIGHNNVEVACKPFLPASKSVRCLPASSGVPDVERPDSSGRKSSGFLSHPHPSDAVSPRVSHAQLHCTFRDGICCYTMTVEGSEEVMLAKACWLDSHTRREGCKWQYSIYSGQGRSRGIGATGWRNWIKKENKTTSGLSGIMEVSEASQCKAPLGTKGQLPLKVLEFVLYDGRGAEVSHSQSFRFCSADKSYPWSKGSASSLSHPCYENIQQVSPTHLDMPTNRQDGDILSDSRASSEKAPTLKSASNIHEGTGCHRLSLSLDAWSDSEVPDSAQSSAPFSSSQVELAAMVVQLPAEGASHVLDGYHIGQRSQGWGVKFLNRISEGEVSHAISPRTAQAEKLKTLERNALDQTWFGSTWPYADPKLVSSCSYNSLGDGLNQMDNYITTRENFRNSRFIAHAGRQDFSGSFTLLLPTGEHSFPISGSKGPSSLIERWRSGGSCECGGWDLGCGINVISSESMAKGIPNREINRSAAYDQPIRLFSQGNVPELMLGLYPVKQGEFKLSFQKQLSPLKGFAAAVAILHSQQSSFLHLSRALQSSTPGKLPPPWPTSSKASAMASLQSSTPSSLTLSRSLMSSSPVNTHKMIPDYKEKPPRPPQNYLVALRKSDPSPKDQISPSPMHNSTKCSN